ncbi:MAG: hypothetical protein BRD45_00505 [Bacteroidetes bacterium QS_8_64_10]|jgi:hypothetical protein|nr:MAG: hypothetical protein BRD45_00505 [Bacteroidetes bacterium QS_8_64_10]
MAEEKQAPSQELATQFTSFATLGVMGTTQELARAVLQTVDEADPELVAEETLCLVAMATSRAAAVGLEDHPEVARTVTPVLRELPFSYRDYLVGNAMIAEKDTSLLDANEEVYRRLTRKQEFYEVHLPEGQFPGEHALNEKMALWMGRVSPPKLPRSPEEHLEELDLVPMLLTHLKLILAFARRGEAPGGSQ